MIKTDVKIGQGEQDWKAGGNSAITKKVLLANMDWKPFHLKHEIQFLNINKPYDTLFCVSFSANKIIGSLFMYYFRKGLIPPNDLKWLIDNGYFQNGVINFNERFTAVNGQTTNTGAYQYLVARGIRNKGLIPQAMFPYADNFADNINPRFITSKMSNLGKEFIKRFPINYEWVDNTDYLKYAPLQGIVRFARNNNPLTILNPVGKTNHAIEVVSKTKTYDEIDDSYYQVYKRYAPNKVFSLLLYHLTINNMSNFNVTQFIKEHDKYLIRNINTGSYGVIYGGRALLISEKRAGLFMVDRDYRNLIGINLTAQLSDNDFSQIEWENF